MSETYQCQAYHPDTYSYHSAPQSQHKHLQKLAKQDPQNNDIFENNLIDTFYPQRPSELEDVCLYDFVANYELQGVDNHGKRKYRKLVKPKLPNHKLFRSRK